VTGFKAGDRVHVEFDGWVSSISLGIDQDDFCVVGPEWATTDVWFKLPLSVCTLIRPPLKVGDVVTALDPEPPRDVILRSNTTRCAWHHDDGALAWTRTGGDRAYQWRDVPGTLTVLYVPEVER
jgi:hypothetical protein